MDIPYTVEARRDTGLTNGKIGIWLFLASEVMLFGALFASYILIRTISRYREYAADRGSALITGAPEYLMSALQKIASGITMIPQQDLRQVETMNAFFIVPSGMRSCGRFGPARLGTMLARSSSSVCE